MQEDVLRFRFPGLCYVLITSGVIGSLHLPADTPPAVRPGYKNVPIQAGGKTRFIQVKEMQDPFQNVKEAGDSTSPDHIDFSKTYSLAHQAYDYAGKPTSADANGAEKNAERTFVTKSYFADNNAPMENSTPGAQSHFAVSSAEGYSTPASGFDKSFATAGADVGQNKAAGESSITSAYQGRTAALGGSSEKTFASSMSSKTYEGPESALIKRDTEQMNEGLIGMKDLPNRPLTIDEVRALINHGVKPDLDEKPAEGSKALNDPDYMPDAAPAPLRAPFEENHLKDSNNDDLVPPPGMMAHPQAMSAPVSLERLPQ